LPKKGSRSSHDPLLALKYRLAREDEPPRNVQSFFKCQHGLQGTLFYSMLPSIPMASALLGIDQEDRWRERAMISGSQRTRRDSHPHLDIPVELLGWQSEIGLGPKVPRYNLHSGAIGDLFFVLKAGLHARNNS